MVITPRRPPSRRYPAASDRRYHRLSILVFCPHLCRIVYRPLLILYVVIVLPLDIYQQLLDGSYISAASQQPDSVHFEIKYNLLQRNCRKSVKLAFLYFSVLYKNAGLTFVSIPTKTLSESRWSAVSVQRKIVSAADRAGGLLPIDHEPPKRRQTIPLLYSIIDEH